MQLKRSKRELPDGYVVAGPNKRIPGQNRMKRPILTFTGIPLLPEELY